jgi:hypothetical protein
MYKKAVTSSLFLPIIFLLIIVPFVMTFVQFISCYSYNWNSHYLVVTHLCYNMLSIVYLASTIVIGFFILIGLVIAYFRDAKLPARRYNYDHMV